MRSGNKVFRPLAFCATSTQCGKVLKVAVESIQSSNENSQLRKLAPFWCRLVVTVVASA